MACANFSRLLAGRKHAAQRMETFALSSLDSYLLSASNVVPILTRTATFPMYSSIFCIAPKVWTFKLQPCLYLDYGILCGQFVSPRAVPSLGLQRRLIPLEGNSLSLL